MILGATGSIGENAVGVARAMRDRIALRGLAAAESWSRLATLADTTGCPQVAIANPRHETSLRRALPADCRILAGEAGMVELCTAAEVDIVLCAISGVAGLRPVLAAIEAGKDIALASKEILVMAGRQVMDAAKRRGVRILPVDSEHSAIFQCLQGESPKHLKRLFLTASGGPFRQASARQLEKVDYRQALAHPTWRMGPKITVDSATLMNKGLELIEAHWLFDIEPADIEVIVHPQSIIHSMVEMIDGSVLAQMGRPDMRLPIQYALGYPERVPLNFSPLDILACGDLQFAPVRERLFPAVRLARQAVEIGGSLPAVFNAANEVAVAAFRAGLVSFLDISRLVAEAMELHRPHPAGDLNTVLAADLWAREATRKLSGC